ncbi:MAG TPA: hypothetical protein VGO93_22055 [Candidatus Xenobia bacterium]
MRAIVGAALVALCVGPASADLKYTMTTSVNGMQMGSTTYVQGMRQRVETRMTMGPMHVKTVMLTLCDKHQSVQIDDDIKMYTVSAINSNPSAMPSMPMAGMHQTAPPCTGGTGRVEMTYGVQDLGTEKVHGLEARHVKLSMHVKSSGCAGNDDKTTDMEEWVSNVKGFSCPEFTAPQRSGKNSTGCDITYVTHGDMAKVGSLLAGMPVRVKMQMGSGQTFEQELSDYSEAPLDGGLFALPSDYRQVTQAQYEAAEAEKMMQQMKQGVPQE